MPNPSPRSQPAEPTERAGPAAPARSPTAAPVARTEPPLGFLLASVGFATMTGFRAVLAPYDLQPRHFAVLRAAVAAQAQSQQALAAALHIPASRIVSLIDDLEQRGLIERHPHPGDRRRHAIHPTKAGHELARTLSGHAAAYENSLFGNLSTAERAYLRALLTSVAEHLGLAPDEHPGMGVGDDPTERD